MINLEEANIPLSVESLGDCIFRNDTALTTVTWPENFEAPELVDSDSNTNIYKGRYVPTSMFDGCTSLGEGIDLEKWHFRPALKVLAVLHFAKLCFQ